LSNSPVIDLRAVNPDSESYSVSNGFSGTCIFSRWVGRCALLVCGLGAYVECGIWVYVVVDRRIVRRGASREMRRAGEREVGLEIGGVWGWV